MMNETTACTILGEQPNSDPSTASPECITITHSNVKHPQRHLIHWFRKGLRLHDNPALYEGLKNAASFRCIFTIDPWFAGCSNDGINKWRFLLHCLEDLDHSLRKINSRLYVVRGQPTDVLPKLFTEWGINCLTFEEDPEPFGKARDESIIQLCREANVEVIQVVSHTLYKLDKIIDKNSNRVPLTYTQFQCIIEQMHLPPYPKMCIPPELLESSVTPVSDDHDDRFSVPSLDELGFITDNLRPPVWQGGETEALRRLERHLERKAWVASFGRPRMTPQSLLACQTGLSPYLRFGCLSVRLFYHQLKDLFEKIKKTKPPLSLYGQLLWREFFYCAATKNKKFDRMKGNPICVQIPWDKNAEALAKWANGQTGFPWIDAIMIQLREEGWIHHLARHSVACFLTRGNLWISWEEGMKVFEELLLDADWSVNAGMWMWVSSSSFFQQFVHCYCPVRFGRIADPNGDFIRKYLPSLKNFPTQYIHEPWNAPENVQKSAKCIVGVDYPMPMIDHIASSRINVERLRQVYLQLYKFHGKSNVGKKVLAIKSDARQCVASDSLANDKVDTTPCQSTSNKCPQLAPLENRLHQKTHNYTAYDDTRAVSCKSNANYLQENNAQPTDENGHAYNTQANQQIYTNYTIDTNYPSDKITHTTYYTEKRYRNDMQETNNYANYQQMAMTSSFDQDSAEYESNTKNLNLCMSHQQNVGLAANCHGQRRDDEISAATLGGDNKSTSMMLAYQPGAKESFACPANYAAISAKSYEHDQ